MKLLNFLMTMIILLNINILRRMMHFDISVAWFTKLFLQFSLSPSPSSSAWEFISARFLHKISSPFSHHIHLFHTIFTIDFTIINIPTVQHKRQFKSSPSKASAASQQGQTTAASYLQQYARPPSQVTATTRIHKYLSQQRPTQHNANIPDICRGHRGRCPWRKNLSCGEISNFFT